MQISHSFLGNSCAIHGAHQRYSTTPGFQRSLGLSQGSHIKHAGDVSPYIGLAGSESHSLVMASANRPTKFFVVGR